MNEPEIKNAVIRSTMLGTEDHGIFTASIQLDYGGSCQGFGGWCLGGDGRPHAAAGLFVQRVLSVAGVSSWEKLVGRPVRVRSSMTSVKAIGHLLNEDWFDPEHEFSFLKEGAR